MKRRSTQVQRIQQQPQPNSHKKVDLDPCSQGLLAQTSITHTMQASKESEDHDAYTMAVVVGDIFVGLAATIRKSFVMASFDKETASSNIIYVRRQSGSLLLWRPLTRKRPVLISSMSGDNPEMSFVMASFDKETASSNIIYVRRQSGNV
ncbi:hypothetical protein CHS0354_005117 [Potamilus streckersoni]|uniref:Uncharacterized protein n=1 Tax=Potamilus streckersoni TaxID=2493646 RepID=A0AAE0SHP1_9BIVA|nr:hypothetical protein CHS0354_005117 [Potamilus streckersoni]